MRVKCGHVSSCEDGPGVWVIFDALVSMCWRPVLICAVVVAGAGLWFLLIYAYQNVQTGMGLRVWII